MIVFFKEHMMIPLCGNHPMTSCDNFFAYLGLLLRVLCLLMCVTSLHFSKLAYWVLRSLVCMCVCVGMCNLVLIKRSLGVLLSIVLWDHFVQGVGRKIKIFWNNKYWNFQLTHHFCTSFWSVHHSLFGWCYDMTCLFNMYLLSLENMDIYL